MTRGTRVIETATGRHGMVVFAFPNGTPDEPQAWAKVVLEGTVFACRLMSELELGGSYGK